MKNEEIKDLVKIDEITTLNYLGQNFRNVTDKAGNPWVVVKDICGIIGIKNHNDVAARLKEFAKGVGTTDPLCKIDKIKIPSVGGDQEMVIINEPALYLLILKSKKPKAEEFIVWLAGTLPQIRKTGNYLSEDDVKEYLAQNIGLRKLVGNDSSVSDLTRAIHCFQHTQDRLERKMDGMNDNISRFCRDTAKAKKAKKEDPPLSWFEALLNDWWMAQGSSKINSKELLDIAIEVPGTLDAIGLKKGASKQVVKTAVARAVKRRVGDPCGRFIIQSVGLRGNEFKLHMRKGVKE